MGRILNWVECSENRKTYSVIKKNPKPPIPLFAIHNDISLIQFVIPGLTRNPVFFWIPAFAGMTAFAVINVAMYTGGGIFFDRSRLFPLKLPF